MKTDNIVIVWMILIEVLNISPGILDIFFRYSCFFLLLFWPATKHLGVEVSRIILYQTLSQITVWRHRHQIFHQNFCWHYFIVSLQGWLPVFPKKSLLHFFPKTIFAKTVFPKINFLRLSQWQQGKRKKISYLIKAIPKVCIAGRRTFCC